MSHHNGGEEANPSSILQGDIAAASWSFMTQAEHGARTASLPFSWGRPGLTASLPQRSWEFATWAMKERRYVCLAVISAEQWHLMAQRQLRASLKRDSWLQLSSCSKSRTELNEVDKLAPHHGTHAGKSCKESLGNLNT